MSNKSSNFLNILLKEREELQRKYIKALEVKEEKAADGDLRENGPYEEACAIVTNLESQISIKDEEIKNLKSSKREDPNKVSHGTTFKLYKKADSMVSSGLMTTYTFKEVNGVNYEYLGTYMIGTTGHLLKMQMSIQSPIGREMSRRKKDKYTIQVGECVIDYYVEYIEMGVIKEDSYEDRAKVLWQDHTNSIDLSSTLVEPKTVIDYLVNHNILDTVVEEDVIER